MFKNALIRVISVIFAGPHRQRSTTNADGHLFSVANLLVYYWS